MHYAKSKPATINQNYMNLMGKSLNNPQMAETSSYYQGFELSHEMYYRDYNTIELQVRQHQLQSQQQPQQQQNQSQNNNNKNKDLLVLNQNQQSQKNKNIQENINKQQQYKNSNNNNLNVNDQQQQDININNNNSQINISQDEKLLQEKDSHMCSHLWLAQNLLPGQTSHKGNRIWLGGYKKRQLSEKLEKDYFSSKHIEKKGNVFKKPVYFQRKVPNPVPQSPQISVKKLHDNHFKSQDNFHLRLENQERNNAKQRQLLDSVKNRPPQQFQVTSNSDYKNKDVKYYGNQLEKVDYFFTPAAVPSDSLKKHGLEKQKIKIYQQENMWPSKYVPESQKLRNRMNMRYTDIQNIEEQEKENKTQKSKNNNNNNNNNSNENNNNNNVNQNKKYDDLVLNNSISESQLLKQQNFQQQLQNSTFNNNNSIQSGGTTLYQQRQQFVLKKNNDNNNVNQSTQQLKTQSQQQINMNSNRSDFPLQNQMQHQQYSTQYNNNNLQQYQQQQNGNFSNISYSQRLMNNLNQEQSLLEIQQNSKKEFDKVMGIVHQKKSIKLSPKQKKIQKDHLASQKRPFSIDLEELNNFDKAKNNLNNFYNSIQIQQQKD